MPTIRSRILKREHGGNTDWASGCLNANDPFEDTETREQELYLVLGHFVSMPTIRSRILKRKLALREARGVVSLNANDPFEDTETSVIRRPRRSTGRSQCQRSVRGY